jgi:hypothetical protein
MSNRIEDAIRKLIMKRRQQDALLENIIKHALVPLPQQNKITAKPKSGAILEHIIKKTLLTEGVAKIVRTKKEDFELAKKCGADHVFAVVTKQLPESRLSAAIAAACNASGGDPESKKEDVGPAGKYASAPDIYYVDNLDAPDAVTPPISAYYYLYGNVKQLGKRYRVTVLVMNTKNALLKYMETHKGSNQGDQIFAAGRKILVGNATVRSMKTMLNIIEDDIKNADPNWYLKNNQEILYPPQAWYDFAKSEFPGVAVSFGQDIPDEQEETDNVQDDIQEVTNKKVGASTFTGTWNNTKGHPIAGQMTTPHPDGVRVSDGTWTYDTNKDEYWFSQGTKKYPDGSYYKGTFNASKFLDGEYYEISEPYTDSNSTSVYKTTTGYKQGGKIDTTKQFKISQFEVTTKKENAYYEGTVDENVKPNNGTVWEDSTKTTEFGKYINGEFKQAETK